MSGGLLLAIEGCGTASKLITAEISGSDMVVQLSDFEQKKAGKKEFRKYLVVQNDLLKYPICVYRFSDTRFEALWMRCTHQGTELQVFGDKMQCPAHGSEFNNRGQVVNGPAATPLRNFPVTITDNQIRISLK
ncbi:Rieske (2Fe-2S) protein [Mucilaginibacter sp. ZT4R22]|uniref:Rieske (2Fe-2S) protein n=1 Tax=Mucilaginibacter pankratovii TaxID=2772110 RepID=A0ABR7WJR1_9SPHI|nr:Rieske (2Fe-2S) protein [Mucilaginibacter pankratovii]MBD1362564.1 Rieske (2Fe-2S) protein [Mucilaginibacter pankratovii]